MFKPAFDSRNLLSSLAPDYSLYRKTCTLPAARPSSTCPLPFFDTVQGEKRKKVNKDGQRILSRAHFALIVA